jgi:hypothetical protein
MPSEEAMRHATEKLADIIAGMPPDTRRVLVVGHDLIVHTSDEHYPIGPTTPPV